MILRAPEDHQWCEPGADRAGLDFAIEVGLDHGGFVPRACRAEDARIPEHYKLSELSSLSYAVRKRNVRESDGTVVFSLNPILTGGSSLTFECAAEVGKLRLYIQDRETRREVEGLLKQASLKHFIESTRIQGSTLPVRENQSSLEFTRARSTCFDSIGKTITRSDKSPWPLQCFGVMSKFDILTPQAKNRTMNVSLPGPMEEFVRQKVAVGDYETASEVVREALRLLKQRDEIWKAEVRSKIKQGMDSVLAGRAVPAQQVKAEMAAFKRKWKKDRSPK